MTTTAPEPDPLWVHPAARSLVRRARRLRQADQDHPWRLDALLAAAVLMLGLGDLIRGDQGLVIDSAQSLPTPGVLAVLVGLGLPLVWRRRAPTAVFAAVLAVCTVQWSLGLLVHSDLALLIALYGMARYAPMRRLPWAAGATFGVLALAAFRVNLISQPLVALFFLCGTATGAIALGLAVRIRKAQLAALADRATRLEIEREQRVQLATVAERARVSREMHDIVGHNLAVIIGLADGGAALAASDPARSAEALRIIAGTGRQALSELRRTLGALRESPTQDGAGEQIELSPQPGIADLDALLMRIRAAGPHVAYRTAGDTAALPPGVQLAVYRIVQEALTNSLKHAGPQTSVQVSVRAGAQAVQVSVQDTGPVEGPPAGRRLGHLGHPHGHPHPHPHPPQQGEGQGLVGIRERAALSGGTASAGPRPAGGGWSVRAELPLPAPAAAASTETPSEEERA
ncbi:signal transduction histidine kinase [Kitasatospora sp. MAP12-15]|uniref:sensor histidine kinase n=1 Tax=unclassified Kitasatospora TaxID=2633591 RepID=UPI0024748C5A|nr:histidine kinase [Kitasatospora sp. MAP12-44]MDH6108686.1 signal transduction histidine kinase [Kitasatospora sp. MAP12-44]